MMKAGITGIGCFAKPEKLTRMLKKVLADFISGEEKLVATAESQAGAGPGLLRAMPTRFMPPAGSDPSAALSNREQRDITGFFVWTRGCCLAISIFTRNGRQDRNTFTAEVNRSSVFRNGRLNQRPIQLRDPLSWVLAQTVGNAHGVGVPRVSGHRL